MRVLRGIALVIGVVAFIFMARRLGWSGITEVLVNTGWWFIVIAAIDVTSAVCDGFAIKAFAAGRGRVTFLRAFEAQPCGVAINRLTPGNALGEPVKIGLLMDHMPRGAAVSTILMFDAGATVIAIGAIVVGSLITLAFVDLPPDAATAAWIGAGALVLVLIGLFVLIRRGPVGVGIGALRALRVISKERCARWRTMTRHIDAMVCELGTTRSSRIGLVALFGSRFFNWVGTILMLYAAGLPLTPVMIIGVLSLGQLITHVSHIVPLGIGIGEGGNYLLYRALGAPGLEGIAFTMVYRARTCVLSAIGLTVLAFTSYRERRRRATVMA
jgi:uncharacterized protein (TIRG00374 family)